MEITKIESYFSLFKSDLYKQIPDGMKRIDLKLLHELDLLHFHPRDHTPTSNQVTNRFEVIETFDKMTLIDEEFVIWIYPEREGEISSTYVLIALINEKKELVLETAFYASGIYNTSHLVLSVLEKYLDDIHETESLLHKIKAEA